MDPFTIFGAGMAVAGAIGGYLDSSSKSDKINQLASQQDAISGQMAGLSRQENNIRKQAATADYIGSIRTSVRNAQVASAQALAGAVNGGAQFSSGVAGGKGQVAGQAGDQIASVGGDYYAGQQIFGIDNQLSTLQTQYNSLQTQSQSVANKPSIWNSIGGVGNSVVANGEKLTNASSGAQNYFSGAFSQFSGVTA